MADELNAVQTRTLIFLAKSLANVHRLRIRHLRHIRNELRRHLSHLIYIFQETCVFLKTIAHRVYGMRSLMVIEMETRSPSTSMQEFCSKCTDVEAPIPIGTSFKYLSNEFVKREKDWNYNLSQLLYCAQRMQNDSNDASINAYKSLVRTFLDCIGNIVKSYYLCTQCHYLSIPDSN